jgi:hypothetical protein
MAAKVDEMKVDVIRAVPPGETGDQCEEGGRPAGTGRTDD